MNDALINAIDELAEAAYVLEQKYNDAQRSWHNFKEWTDDEWDPIHNARHPVRAAHERAVRLAKGER